MKTIAVIGAGASGLMAASVAASHGAKVLLIEKNSVPGKKLNATGGGKGNVANLKMGPMFYHSADPERLGVLIGEMDQRKLFFEFSRIGLLLHERNGYFYPRTDLASTVTDAFIKDLQGKEVRFVFGQAVQKIERLDGHFLIHTSEQTYEADAVILATGSLAGSQFGACADGIRIAEDLGHGIEPLCPALAALKPKDVSLRAAAGVRTHGKVWIKSDIPAVNGQTSCEGEIQFNKDSISGIPVLQISRYVSVLLQKGIHPVIAIDLLPEIEDKEWEEIILSRMSEDRNLNIREWLLGLVHPGLIAYLSQKMGLTAENKIRKISDETRKELLWSIRNIELVISDTADYRDCQVTAGGVRLKEINDSYESEFCPGLYLVGEVLDVDGICGGYNLSFAMSSGMTAALSACKEE